MRRVIKRLAMFMVLLLLNLAAAPLAWAADEVAGTDISISIEMAEENRGTALIPPLRLSCPAGTTPFSLLDLLCRYSYLSGYHIRDGALLWVELEEDGEQLRYTDPDGWELLINGSLAPNGILSPLQDGDSLQWAFSAGDASETEPYSSRHPILSAQPKFWDEEHAERLSQASSWLKNNFSHIETMICLGAAGISVDYQNIDRLKDAVQQTPIFDNPTQLAQYILAATFCGLPATNVYGYDLLADLSSYPDILQDGVQSAASALIAADSNDYPLPTNGINTRATLCSSLLSCQNEDGGFGAAPGQPSTVYHTSLALIALAHYKQDDGIQLSLQNALEYLVQQQNTDGTFPPSDGHSTAESTGFAVTALCALGLPAGSARFEGHENPLDALLSFQTQSGGFAPEIGSAAEESATSAAVLALTAAKNSRNVLILRTPIANDTAASSLPPASDSSEFPASYVTALPKQPSYHFAIAATAAALLCAIPVLLICSRRRRKK